MFIHYQFSTFLWLLLQVLECSEQITHRSYFPFVPEKVTDQNFPIIHNTNASSNLVMIKCPGYQYKHIRSEDSFAMNEKLRSPNLFFFTNNENIAWAPLVYNSSGPSFIKCGKLSKKIKNTTSSFNNYYWTYNLNWEKEPIPMQLAEPRYISTSLPYLYKKCGYNDSEYLIYHKDNENSIKKVEFRGEVLTHVNDFYYYFIKPKDDDKMEIKKPCAIVRVYYDPPIIEIKDQIYTPISSGNLDNDAIKQEYVSRSYLIKLSIKGKTKVPDFYKGEEVKMKKLNFTRTGIEEISNSDQNITSLFSIHGFQLLKFSYEYPTRKGTDNTSRIVYFGPKSKSYVFPNEDILYLSNETTIQPNCSIQRITYGYLESVIFGGVTTNFTDLPDGGSIKNNLKRVGDFIFMADAKEDNVTLKCFYITYNGSVTFVQTFIKEDKIKNDLYEKGEKIYEAKMENAKKEFNNKLAEKDKQLAAHNKTLFEKLKDKLGIFGAYAVLIVSGLLILIITLMIIVLCCIKILIPWIIRKKIQSKHPNIFKFWESLSNQDLKAYAETVQSSKYIPDKLKNQVISKKIEGGEVVESNTNACFDRNLVKCFKDIDGEVKAHYISGVSPTRTYIISDGPAPDKVEFFWEMLYREEVTVVFAIIFQEQETIKNSHGKLFYWPKVKERYGKITVEFCEKLDTETPFVTVRRFTMTMKNGKPKKLIHFHISNWKEHDIPHSDRLIIKLYKEISEQAGLGTVLVHTTHGSGSRVFIFTYFACIFEAMKENDAIDEPLEVIKEVRSQRYGGNISSIEYAYIARALITYFFECKMLVDTTNHRLAFNDEYDNFILKLGDREAHMDPDLKNFLSFVNIVDDGKLKDLCDQCVNVQRLSEVDLRLQCKRFFAVLNMEALAKMKIRYKEIPCLDASSVNIRGKGLMDVNGFIHANEFKYKYGAKERKMIMCQAPSEESMDDMLDMIHRYKIGIIVVLVNKDELDKGAKCFPYLLTTRKEITFGAYNLLYQGHKSGKNNYFTEYDYSVIDKASRLVHTFKLLHYLNWPDRTIPTEKQSLHGLYKRIIDLYDNSHIVIHCSAGIGRTGTLALIIYMIDVIKSKQYFDPLKCLAKIRKYRCKAVQTIPQFVFALSILYEHFKDQIDRMDDKAYENFMSLADKIYEKSNNIMKKKIILII
uniref:Protein-tyrosine-phosphatase n=2 Tax=Strongyloides stercoralis TaxID=6248 RepID=A0A0K0EBP4_STRER